MMNKKDNDNKPKLVSVGGKSIAEEEKGLRQLLSELNDNLKYQKDIKEEKKERKARKMLLPWNIRGKAKPTKKGKVQKFLIVYLRNNRTVTPVIGEMGDEGLLRIGNRYYTGGIPFTFLWNGKIPCMVVPEWSLEPIGTQEYIQAIDGKKISDPQGTIIRMLEARENQEKKPISGNMILIGILVIAGAAYLLFGGGA